jgi:hypothetical protein
MKPNLPFDRRFLLRGLGLVAALFGVTRSERGSVRAAAATPPTPLPPPPGTPDAAAVPYAPRGTGAVRRTVASKLNERASVMDFIPNQLWPGIESWANDQDLTPYIQAALDARAKVHFPAGEYPCNLELKERHTDRVISTDGWGTQFTPATAAKPVIHVNASDGIIRGIVMEDMFVTKVTRGNGSPGGVGLKLTAFAPNAVTGCRITHLHVRGFNEGLVLDCDRDRGEIFNNYFGTVEAINCIQTSVRLRGVYNEFGKILVTDCGHYALFSEAAQCFIPQVISDGVVVLRGTGMHIPLLYTENMHGAGDGNGAVQLLGEHHIGAIWLAEVDNAKCPIGVQIFFHQQIGSILTVGGRYPREPVRLNSGSSGIIGMLGPKGADLVKIGANGNPDLSQWRFGITPPPSVYDREFYLTENLARRRNGSMAITGANAGAWNGAHLELGAYHIWVDASGRLRGKNGAPRGDADGTVLGA